MKIGADTSSSSTQDVPSPDLMTQAINMFSTPTSNTQNSTSEDDITPALPPTMAAMRNKSTSEILSVLNKTPLFMTSLEENDDIEALRALAYEGTPLEIVSGFKERGNECFKERAWKDAKEFYGKAISVLLAEVRKRQKGEKAEATTEQDIKQEVHALETCLVNRAACNLKLKNYRSCVQDCGIALGINSENIKGYYRSSTALLALDRILEADDVCARGLVIDPENKPLLSLADAIIKRNHLVVAKKRTELEREQRIRLEAATLAGALKARSIKIRKTKQPPEMDDAKIELVPDSIDPESTLNFPTVLLYPLHLESDFIKAFNETQTLGDHLNYIMPLPWDTDREYTEDNIECYFETIAGGLIKVGRKVSLLKVLSSGSVEVVDEVVKIFVVPRAKAVGWVAEFKHKKFLENGSA